MTENGTCKLHSGIEERIKDFKWLIGILIGCLIGLFGFQGVILTQINDIRMQSAVIVTKVTTMEKGMNGR